MSKMMIIDLYGAPGAGKSTNAAAIFSTLKNEGYKVSLISEAATDLIESGQSYVLHDPELQPYILGLQWRKIKDQERLGTEILVTDSPIIHQINYVRGHWSYELLMNMYQQLMGQFPTYSVLLLNKKKFSPYKRVTTAEDSDRIQEELKQLRPYDLIVPGTLENLPTIISGISEFRSSRLYDV